VGRKGKPLENANSILYISLIATTNSLTTQKQQEICPTDIKTKEEDKRERKIPDCNLPFSS